MTRCLIFALTIFFSGFFMNNLIGQQKYEKESRMKPRDVPAAALEFMDLLDVNSKVKWFWEEGLDDKSVEAKYKLNKRKYSAEFDTLGKIQDIEMTMEWTDLPVQLRDSIGAQLDNLCVQHKVVKVQIQYSGTRASLLSKMRGSGNTETCLTKYEVIANCRSEEGIELFEYLFSDTGQMLSVFKIIFKNSSHLEY